MWVLVKRGSAEVQGAGERCRGQWAGQNCKLCAVTKACESAGSGDEQLLTWVTPPPPLTLFLTGRAQRLQAKSDPSVESALFHMQTSLDKMARKCRGKGGGMAGEGEQDGS